MPQPSIQSGRPTTRCLEALCDGAPVIPLVRSVKRRGPETAKAGLGIPQPPRASWEFAIPPKATAQPGRVKVGSKRRSRWGMLVFGTIDAARHGSGNRLDNSPGVPYDAI